MNQSKSMPKKQVVVMGGGNGSSISLCALKEHLDLFDISAVTSMVDSGYSTGAMRKKFGMLPPGDIMRASVSMSIYPYKILKPIFYKNRTSTLEKLNTELKAERGPSLGNLFLLFASQYEGDFIKALRALEETVEAVGHAYPSTVEQSELVVELTNGDMIQSETKIDEPEYNRDLKIKKAWLEPEVSAYEEALKKIREADYIIFGPGDLYTSIVASLLPKGIYEAIAESKAHLTYVVGNAYHTEGETGPEKLSDFILELENYLPRKLDHIIYNNAELSLEQSAIYVQRKWSLVEQDVISSDDLRIVEGNYERTGGGLCPEKLGEIFKQLAYNCNI